MAGLNPPLNRPASQRIGSAAISAPRLVMSWEDWLTFSVALIAFSTIAVSIQRADWVDNMPSLVPPALGGLLIGMLASRIRYYSIAIHPIAIALGVVLIVLSAQPYADGTTLGERLEDFRFRMHEWWIVVRAGDISNDNLPFVTLVHSVCFLSAYLGAWSVFRWHNAWLAIIPGGVVLLANIAFLDGHPSGAIVVFLFASVLLLSRSHIQQSQARWKRLGVDYPDWMSISATQLTVVLTTALLIAAWALPTGSEAGAVGKVFDKTVSPLTSQTESLGRLFHNIDSRKGARLHTFGNTLAIQGEVKLGTKQLLEVTAGAPGLIRATSYDQYTGNGWKVTSRDSERLGAKELAPVEDAALYKERIVTVLRATVLDREGTILTAGTPLGTNVASNLERSKLFAGDIERIESRRGMTKGDTYNSIGSESRATDVMLQAAGSDYPDWIDKYLQLPDDLPQRVRDEAARVTARGQNPYDKAIELETFLRTFPYDLTVASAPAGEDTVDFFLFTLRRGYFDYQSTAMAVMLRTLGIPSRVAVGYVLDTNTAQETKYTVRKDDAYSWVEVFFPEYGWITFNPTQDRPAGGAGSGLNSSSSEVAPPDLGSLIGEDLFENPFPGESDPIAGAISEDAVQHSEPPWALIYGVTGALTALVALYFAGRFTWNWGLGGLDPRAQLWAKTQRLSRWAGFNARSNETPREWSRRMGEGVEHPAEATILTDAFEEIRYGRPDLQRIDDEDASSAYTRLRGALLGTIFRRKRRTKREPDVTRFARRR